MGKRGLWKEWKKERALLAEGTGWTKTLRSAWYALGNRKKWKSQESTEWRSGAGEWGKQDTRSKRWSRASLCCFLQQISCFWVNLIVRLCLASCSGLLFHRTLLLPWGNSDPPDEPSNLCILLHFDVYMYRLWFEQIYLGKTKFPLSCHSQNLSYTNPGSCFKQNLFSKTYVQIKCLWNKCCFSAVIMKATVYYREPAAAPCALSLLAYTPSQ